MVDALTAILTTDYRTTMAISNAFVLLVSFCFEFFGPRTLNQGVDPWQHLLGGLSFFLFSLSLSLSHARTLQGQSSTSRLARAKTTLVKPSPVQLFFEEETALTEGHMGGVQQQNNDTYKTPPSGSSARAAYQP